MIHFAFISLTFFSLSSGGDTSHDAHGVKSRHHIQKVNKHDRDLFTNGETYRVDPDPEFELPSFYHKTEQITKDLMDLGADGKCPGLSLQSIQGDTGEVTIDVVDMKRPDANPRRKMFLLFGEHARELISPETGLHFIKRLCDTTDVEAQNTLKHTEFRIIVNGNPNSRQKVEKGDTCLRVNDNGVDLNRNWDEHFKTENPEEAGTDTYPGTRAFSEAETRIFKSLLDNYNPTTFMTIHSGTLALLIPPAFTTNPQKYADTENAKSMLNILEAVDKKYCQCPVGAAGKEVGYECPGTCLDYAAANNIPFTFASEIYTNPEAATLLREEYYKRTQLLFKRKSSFLLQKESSSKPKMNLMRHHNLASDLYKDMFRDHPSDFVQLKKSTVKGKDFPGCFDQFNPGTKEKYQETIDNWSTAFLEIAKRVDNIQSS